MIIYGTRTLSGQKAEGDFHCPRCKMPRRYRQMEGRTWFTLYFIPLIPMWRSGEYIECAGCAATYGSEVLSYRPDVDPAAEVLADVRRALVLLFQSAGRTGPAELNRLFQWWQQSGMAPISLQTLEEDMRLAQEANAQLGPFIQARLQHLEMNARLTLLRSGRQALVGTGHPEANDERALRTLGTALQIAPATVDAIIRGQ